MLCRIFANPNLCNLSFRSGLSIDKGEFFMIFSAEALKNNLIIHKAPNNFNECQVKFSFHELHYEELLNTLNCVILALEVV